MTRLTLSPDDFPLLQSSDYFQVDKVYRLEMADGSGPIIGESRATDLLRFLKTHLLPHEGIRLNREVFPENERFTKELYYPFMKAGVFGWRSLELYNEMFIEDGERRFMERGFRMVVYTPSDYLPMPDGQVIFAR